MNFPLFSETPYHGGMVVHGKVQGGVVVLDEGVRLPEGTRVVIVPRPAPDSIGGGDEMSPEEHQRICALIDAIAALPIEGTGEMMSGADHDEALYGQL